MDSGMLAQVLGGVLSGRSNDGADEAQGGGGSSGGLGGIMGGLGGGLGGLTDLGAARRGGLLGALGVGVSGLAGEKRSGLLPMLLPLAIQWILRNGGLGSVLRRADERGYGQQAASWVGTGGNQPLDAAAVRQLMGQDELAQMADRVGAPQDEVAREMSRILPEVVNQATPEGRVPDDADERLSEGERLLRQLLPAG